MGRVLVGDKSASGAFGRSGEPADPSEGDADSRNLRTKRRAHARSASHQALFPFVVAPASGMKALPSAEAPPGANTSANGRNSATLEKRLQVRQQLWERAKARSGVDVSGLVNHE